MKRFIFLLYSSLLLIGKFAPSDASPTAAAAGEPGRTTGKQEGTSTTTQNTNRGQKRVRDDDGAGPSKAQKQTQTPSSTPTAKVYKCYGLKLQLLGKFSSNSEVGCALACEEKATLYREYLWNINARYLHKRGCFQSSVCVNTTLVSAEFSAALWAERACTLSLCPPNVFQCECEATLIAFRVHHVDPRYLYLVRRWVTNGQPTLQHSWYSCHYIFIARLLTQAGWVLQHAAWDPLVDCDQDSPGTAERGRLCHCKKPGPKSKSSQSTQCTATLQREVVLQVPLTQSIFTIDLNKEPAEDPVAPLTAAGSSQQPNLNLECTQTFLSFGLEQNEVCLDPKDPQPGYCPPGP